MIKQKKLKLILLPVMALFAGLSISHAQAEQQAKIKLTDKSKGPYFKLTIPAKVYRTSVNPDLKDIRIKNSRGEELSFSWLHHQAEQVQVEAHDAPIFPFRNTVINQKQYVSNVTKMNDATILYLQNETQNSASNSEIIKVIINSNGTLNQYEEANKQGSATIKGWIIDTSQFIGNDNAKAFLLQAHFEIEKQNEGIAGIQVDTSDNLINWETLHQSEQLIQLKHKDEQIQKLSIPLHHKRKKYLKVTWLDDKNQFTIKKILIDSQKHIFTEPTQEWSDVITPTQCTPSSCVYTIPKNTPVDSLRILLNDTNTVAKLNVYGISTEKNVVYQHKHRNPFYLLRNKTKTKEDINTTEFFLSEYTAYRIQPNPELQDESISSDLALNGQAFNKIRIDLAQNISVLGSTPPNIQIGTYTQSLVFLTRGHEPFTMVWGDASKQNTSIELTTLLQDNINAKLMNAGSTTIEFLPAQTNKIPLALKDDTGENNKYWLWLILGAGLAILGAMVWSTLATMKKHKQKLARKEEKRKAKIEAKKEAKKSQ